MVTGRATPGEYTSSHLVGETIFAVVQAKFNYHVVDVFSANQDDGTGC